MLALVVAMAVAMPAVASDESDALANAIQLFDRGEYLAAQEVLAGIDRAKLDAKEQTTRDDYLSRVQIAITMEDKALRNLEDAETAIADGEATEAERLLEAVLANEYASQAVRRSAEAKLADVRSGAAGGEQAKQDVIKATSESHGGGQSGDAERARALTDSGNELAGAARYDEAVEKYEAALQAVPGFPEAVEGIERVRLHQRNDAQGSSLVNRIRRDDAINWQRTVTQYRDVDVLVREHVAKSRFQDAGQLLVRAGQIVESGKQYADPVTKYENLRSELDALTSTVADAERKYHEDEVAKTRRDIEAQRSAKLREIEQRRANQVNLLMEQAMQHRKDGELPAAIALLRQVAVIDPQYQPARWMMDTLEEQQQYNWQQKNRDTFYKQSQSALIDVEESKIPWWQTESAYPDNWLELIKRPERQIPGRGGKDSLLISALDQPIDVDFDREPFQQVMQAFADAYNVNIIVNWHDLKNAGIEADAPISLSLPNQISLKKAMTEVLDQAGAGVVDIGFDVADGAVSVATSQTLATRTYPAVYAVNDLLMDIPAFTGAPASDLRDATQPTVKKDRSADLPWRAGVDDDDDPEQDFQRHTKVQELIGLIEDTVDPDSWRDRGGTIGTIREINGQLVITQNSAAQRQIGGLLDKLREQRAIQIAVEAIFLTVSNHYLEELGMDLDIVLNGGNAGFDFLDEGGGSVAVDPVLGSRLLLPRTFSRLGETPNVPGIGTATASANAAVNQPFTQAFLVPQANNGSGANGTPIPILSGVTQFTNPANLPSDIPGSFAGQAIGPALSIMGSFLDNIQVDFLIRATQADSRTTVLTAPRLVVFNGGSAWVAVTLQQNFVSQLQPVVAQGAVAQAPQTATIDAGASLFVRATVTADRRYVMLLLAPGITRLLDMQTFPFSGGTGALSAFIQLPTLSSQRIQTMVSVPDGGTLLIGGQKLAAETEVEAGVPILSKIPVLKRAYTSRTTVKDEQTLLILIKPKVLIHSEQEQLSFPSFTQR